MKAVKPDQTPRGELNLRAAQGQYLAGRFAPADDLVSLVLYYWLVRWDRVGMEPYDQSVLTQPYLHFVFELDALALATSSRVVGVMKRRFTRRLQGKGQVVGIAFQPGVLCRWLDVPAAQLADRMVPLDELLPVDARALEASIFTPDDDQGRVARVEGFLRQHAPAPDGTSALVKDIVDRVSADPDILRVDDLLVPFGIGKREVQRLFHRYVGASPKWVIRRYRLIEAARRLEAGEALPLAELAASLGYFDQAHFIKDFKATVGRTPGSYARIVRADERHRG